MSERVRLSGRFIKKKELERREKVRQANMKKRKDNCTQAAQAKPDDETGNRIVNISALKNNLQCKQCNVRLGFDRIVSELREGVHSVFMIKCDSCNQIIRVDTGEYHMGNDQTSKFLQNKKFNNITTSMVLGTIESGIGLAELNKLLACCDILTVSPKIYKKYEREVGEAIEREAKLSCKRATLEERRLVLENIEKLEKEL